MARGRPRKSLAMHKHEGTYRPERHDNLQEPAVSGKPIRPRGLNYQERWIWDLVAANWMGEIDTAQLRELCQFWSLMHESLKLAKKDPTDSDCRQAAVQYAQQFDRLASKFGLNPRDRAYLAKPRDAGKQTTDDEYFGVVG